APTVDVDTRDHARCIEDVQAARPHGRVRVGHERAPAIAGRALVLRARGSVEQHLRRTAEHAHAGDQVAAGPRGAVAPVARGAVAARDRPPVAAAESTTESPPPAAGAAPGARPAGAAAESTTESATTAAGVIGGAAARRARAAEHQEQKRSD